MDFSEFINFLSKHHSLIVTAITGVIIFSRFIAKNVLNIETKSDKRKSIISDLEIANYLVDPKVESHLVNQIAFEALTGQKASFETMQWIFKCHDPSTALEIYASVPRLLKIDGYGLSEAKWVKKYANRIYWLTFTISMTILISICVLTFYSLGGLVDMSMNFKQGSLGNESRYTINYIIAVIALFIVVTVYCWIANKVASIGIFVVKVEKFYRGVNIAKKQYFLDSNLTKK